jgi:hypothetical protein
VTRITTENVRDEVKRWGDGEFRAFRKVGTTEMAFATVPAGDTLVIDTKEGAYELPGPWEGLIALDADGDPYPVEMSVFYRTYEPA